MIKVHPYGHNKWRVTSVHVTASDRKTAPLGTITKVHVTKPVAANVYKASNTIGKSIGTKYTLRQAVGCFKEKRIKR